ncbi:MAG: hypothetical protein V1701_04280 [Planctomycetota bacterium]
MNGTKSSGGTSGQATTKQSSILLASASSAKSPVATTASAKTATSATVNEKKSIPAWLNDLITSCKAGSQSTCYTLCTNFAGALEPPMTQCECCKFYKSTCYAKSYGCTCDPGYTWNAAGSQCVPSGGGGGILDWIKKRIADYEKTQKEKKEKKDAEAIAKFNAEYEVAPEDADHEKILAPVKCNFWGGCTIDGNRQVYNDMPCGTQKCLNKRKNAYIADIKAAYPDACKGGWFKNPPFPVIPEDFRKKTECSVYPTEVACLDRLLAGNISDACRGFINKRAADIEITSPVHFGCMR